MTKSHDRLQALQERLKSLKADALIITHPVDLYYLTELTLSCGTLVITTDQVCLLVDGRYIETAKISCHFPVFVAKEGVLKELLAALRPSSVIAFDGFHTSYSAYRTLQGLAELLCMELISCEQPLKELRSIKDEEEIGCLKLAAQLAMRGFEYVCQLLKEGISEKKVAKELEIFWLKEGADGLSFDPIIAFGKHSAFPHHRCSNTSLKSGEVVLIDIGVCVNRYQSDMTRTLLWGPVSAQLKEIFQVVKEAKEKATALCQPGVTVGELDSAARQVIIDAGYGDFFPHSLGHGVGLEIHEFPLVRNQDPHGLTSLKPNMIITIEPGIYLPEVGGVRLEDTLRITSQGYELLTCSPIEG